MTGTPAARANSTIRAIIGALAHALVVVAHQHQVDFGHGPRHAGQQLFGRCGRDWPVVFAVNAHHLMRITLLAPGPRAAP